jgi:hypothetical protein
MMSTTSIIRRRIRFRASSARTESSPGGLEPSPGRLPRVSRLMALAIRLETLIQEGQVPNLAALAGLAHVSRARVTQIANLTLLAPDIQEALLFLPPVQSGRDPITERDLRPIAAEPNWARQRAMWARVMGPRDGDGR